MKRFLIEFLITFVIVCITRIISDTYICGGIAGILMVYSALFIDEFYKRLKESDYYEVKKETQKFRKELKELKRKNKALDQIHRVTKKYDLELSRDKLNNENILIIRGIDI